MTAQSQCLLYSIGEILPNPDCFVGPYEAHALSKSVKEIANGLQEFARYCEIKGYAMQARLQSFDGKIDEALRLESTAEKIYKKLPAELRW